MRGLSAAITDILAGNGVITEEDKPLYNYGLHQLGMTILNALTAVIIGATARMLWQSVLFLLAYIPLRRFAGGYHAKTELRCYIASTLLVAFSLFVIRAVSTRLSILFPIFLISSVVIFFLSPVDSANKPLDTTEYAVYRRRSRGILALHLVVAITAWPLSALEVVSTIVVADAVLSVMLILGWVKNQIQSNEK